MPKAILITESFLNNFKDPKLDNKANFNRLPKVLKNYIEENKDKINFHFLISKKSSWLPELNKLSKNVSENESYNAAKEGHLIHDVIKKSDDINKSLPSEILILTYDGYNLIKKQKKYKVQKNLTGLVPFYKSHPKLTFGAIIPFAFGLACLAVGTVLTFTGVFSPLGAAMTLAGVNIAFSSLTTFGLATAGFCGIVGVASTWVATVFILNVIKTISALKRISKFNADNNKEKFDSMNSSKKINDALSLNGTESALHSKKLDSQKQVLIEEFKLGNLDNKNTIISATNVANNNKPKESIIEINSSSIKVSSNLSQQQPFSKTEDRKAPECESKNNSENKNDYDSDDESFHSCTSSNEDYNQAPNSPSK